MENTISISSSMEDYLETILFITEKHGSARISEIADKLNIAASSVTEVIGKLSKLNLVTQEKYGPVILTSKGRNYAENVACRHQIIKSFLIDVLGVNSQVAEKDACLMEHVISPVTMEHLVNFLSNIDGHGGTSSCEKMFSEKSQGGEGKLQASNINTLGKMSVGSQGKVVRVTASGNLKRRFLDMGLVQGAAVKIKGKAPFGDPIKIDIQGYDLSLRKKEANQIYVEVE